jgi:amino acid adenylation domain-containing protein
MNLKRRIAKLSPGQRKLLKLKLERKQVEHSKGLASKKNTANDGNNFPITASEEKEYYPVSSSQKRMYILNNFIQYNMPLAYRVEGHLDKNRIQETFIQLIQRHENLRTTFHLKAGEPVQKTHGRIDFNITYHDYTGKDDIETNPGRIEPVLASIFRDFDLSAAPLLRVGLVKISSRGYLFIVNIHHIISDGVSMGILAREFAGLYRGEKLQEMKIQYKDFAQWEKRRDATDEYRRQESYWLEMFSGPHPVLDIPTDYPRPAVQQFTGDRVHFTIEGETYHALKKRALQQNTSIYMMLLAVYNTLLHRYTQQEDIVVGSITAGRERWETDSLIGVFINPIALRNKPQQDKTFADFLEELKQNTLKAFENQAYPFGDLLDKVVEKKDLSRSPLFDVMMIYQSVDMKSRNQLDRLQVELDRYQYKTAHHSQQDMTIWAALQGERLRMDLEYCTALFKHKTMARFARHYLTLLESATTNPELKLADLEFISRKEKQQILEQFNDTKADFPENKTVVQLFEEQVEIGPHRIAIAGDGRFTTASEKNITNHRVQLSYKKLNQRSNRLGSDLRKKGVGPNTIVAIKIDRSIEMITNIMGILKAGGAYLPIDPNYPQERIDYILKDSNAQIVIENAGPQNSNEQNKRTTPEVSNFEKPASDLSTSLSYIIYTSGTTGKPKGVMVQQDNFFNAAMAWRQEYNLETMEINLLQLAGITFDVFAGDIARALPNGGKLIVCPDDIRMDSSALYTLIRKEKITLFESTPAQVIPFMEYVYDKQLPLDNLQLLIIGSDTCRTGDFIKMKSRFGHRIRIINSYGVTEATIDSSFYDEPLEQIQSTGNVPIGKPLPNMQFLVLNPRNQLQPVGIPGELYIGGAGISRGYLNNPDLTAARFVKRNSLLIDSKINDHDASTNNQHSTINHLLYRTGDHARWLPDGNIEFLGRIDRQVKIRGYRIELKEIEIQLMSHTGVKEAVVISKKNESGDSFLCAYLVPGEIKELEKLSASEIRRHLSRQLPEYMLPAQYVEIDKIPLTPNGKIDETALKNHGPRTKLQSGTQYEAPTNEIEEKLTTIWSTVLKKEPIGIHDNFFDLGGQSILAMRVLADIQEQLEIKIPLVTFFRQGTIRGIAGIIANTVKELENEKDQKDGLASRKSLIQPFDLEKPPLMRATLVKMEERRHFFFLDMHHMITDGFSLNIITNDFSRFYSGEEPEELQLQYKDYSQWQSQFFNGNTFRRQEKYWLELFKGDIPVLKLPLDYPLSDIRKATVKKVQVKIHPWEIEQLKKMAAQRKVTLYMLLLAVYTVVLAKTTGQDDIIIGTPVSGRTHAVLNNLVGMFVNTLVLRLNPLDTISFAEFLKNVKQHTLTAQENQDYPFEMLVEKLNLSGETGRNPLFDTMFTVQQLIEKNLGITAGNLKFIPYQLTEGPSMFDLVVGALITENEIRLNFNYNAHLFREETIRKMVEMFTTILSSAIKNPEQRINELTGIDISNSCHRLGEGHDNRAANKEPEAEDIEEKFSNDHSPIELSRERQSLTQQQKEWILNTFNDTRMECPSDKTIHQLFEQQAQKTPFRTAAICENRQLTYGELSKRSDQVAELLREKGIKIDAVVGLLVQSSIDAIVGIFGALKAGACYLPLLSEYPEDQLNFLVTDASITVIMAQQRLVKPFIAGLAKNVILLDKLPPHRRTENTGAPVTVKPENSAYIIYTSGSTGRPKGVLIDHKAVVNRIFWMQKMYPLTPTDTILQKTTLIFDVSAMELFGWFLGGARLGFMPPTTEADLNKILETIEKLEITIASYTPTVLHTFFLSLDRETMRKLSSLRWIISAGEQLPLNLVEKWSGFEIETKLENLYGPTEATVYASYYSCDRLSNPKPVPIGKPLGNSRLYVMNEYQEMMPPGEVGELVIAGAGLARGYLNRPDLTSEKFLPDPFFPGEKMYRTGDYAKLLPSGNIVYMGRIDSQVKIKGVRIELGEIETTMLKHPDIKKAAVIDRDDRYGVKYLAAYIESTKSLTLRELRTYMIDRLPGFMVPTEYNRVERMPMTASGKLDRKSLSKCGTVIKADSKYIAPRTELEKYLAALWAEFLKMERVGIDDNFMEIGGDSLRGNILLAEINNRYNTGLIIKDLIESPTIREFAHIITHSKTIKYPPITFTEKKEYYITTSAQKRIYFVHQLDKKDTGYNIPSSFIVEGDLDKERFKNALNQLVKRHEPLRTRFRLRGGEIVQEIDENTGIEMKYFQVEKYDIANEQTYIEQIINGEISGEPQNCENNLLSGVKLTKVSTDLLQDEKNSTSEYGVYEASSAQKRLYLINRQYGSNILYNMPFGWLIEGQLDPRCLEDAVKKLIQRHKTLRTTLESRNGEIVQIVREYQEFEFQLKYRTIENDIGYGSEISEIVDKLSDTFVQPFDLAKAPLWRIELVRLMPDKHLLLFDIHHIICDGVSVGVVLDDVMTYYNGKELPQLDYRYVDFAQWQNKQWETGRIKRQEQFWLDAFEGELPQMELPLDYPRPQSQPLQAETIQFEIDDQLTAKLNQLAGTGNTTMYVILLSLYTILLSKLTQTEDIIVGSPVTGRTHNELESIIGMFVNTLAMRNYPRGDKQFDKYMQDVTQNVFSAFENQDYPFEMLVEKVAPNRQINRNPIFETMLVLQNFRLYREFQQEGQHPDEKLTFIPVKMKENAAKFDVTLDAAEEDGRIYIGMQYRAELFRKDTMERFALRYVKLAQQVVTNPEVRLADLDITTEEEKRAVLDLFNATGNAYPENKTLHGLFTEQAARTPDGIAITAPDEENRTIAITYKQLDQQSERLAQRLREKGVKSDEPVGISLKRSIRMVAGILGILKAGAPYLPIPPEAPEKRTQYILRDSNARIIIRKSETDPNDGNTNDRSRQNSPVDLGLDELEIEFVSGYDHGSAGSASDASSTFAYIIYTSGSTGEPRGVPVTHDNLSPLFHWGYKEIGMGPGDRTIQNVTVNFDWSVWEIFITLTTGATLYTVPEDIQLNPEKSIDFMKSNSITVLHITPSQYRYLVNTGRRTETLKYLFIGGEKLAHEQVARGLALLNPDCLIFNMYGLTETAIISTAQEIKRNRLEEYKRFPDIPIGKPVGDTGLLILDKDMNQCPPNVTGELYIYGDCVADGYLNNPELTAARFIDSPLKHHPAPQYIYIYKTGDRVRWHNDGYLEFRGRADHQVKIRGNRIELGEIENQLLALPYITEAAVIDTSAENGEKYLCAYIVTNDPHNDIKPEELKNDLASNLPDYMIPAYFLRLDKLPVTDSGKVNRKKLPETGLIKTGTFAAPRNNIEKKLAEIWSEVLNRQEKSTIGIDDNFFELGGHSLKAAILVSKIHKELNVDLSLSAIFENRTIRRQAKKIRGMAVKRYEAIEPIEKKEYYEQSSAQKRLYFLQQMEPGSTAYNMPSMLPVSKDIPTARLETILKASITRHESLRTSLMEINEIPVQKIHDRVDFDIEVMDGSDKKAIQSFIRPFDLGRAPLVRAALIIMPGNNKNNMLMVDMHHIVSDGTSHIVLMEDFLTQQGKPEQPLQPPAPIQYKEFTHWQNTLIKSGAIKHQEAYWLQRYSDIASENTPRLNLPADKQRPDVFTYEGSNYQFKLAQETALKFKRMCTRYDVTLYMNILAALNTLFYKYTGQTDIIIGTVTAGRPHHDLQRIIGMFVNTLAIRNFPRGEKSYLSFLEEVSNNSLEALENQDVQLEDLLDRLKPERDLSRNPLFDIALVVQNQGEMPREYDKLVQNTDARSPLQLHHGKSKFDMTVTVAENEEDIRLAVEYYTGIFKEDTIRRMTAHLQKIIRAVTEHPGIKLKEIEILTEQEKKQILETFNSSVQYEPAPQTLPQIFEEQAARTPEKIAITTLSTPSGTAITYRELKNRVDAVAHRLRKNNAGTDTIVAVKIERSLEMLIAILGILRAGAAYLPIDPDYPEERIEYILKDSNAKILMVKSKAQRIEERNTRAETESKVKNTTDRNNGSNPVILDIEHMDIPMDSNFHLPVSDFSSSSLAYVIYTSGSTGKPKGVAVQHSSVVNIIQGMQAKYPLMETDVYLLKTSVTFDVSAAELFGWYPGGGRLAILEPGGEKDPAAIIRAVQRNRVTHLNFVPSMLGVFLEYLDEQTIQKIAGLKYIFSAGEALLPHQVNRFRQLNTAVQLENIYGPTEAAIYSAGYSLSQWNGGTVPIGKPLQNIRLYILSHDQQLQPVGVVGELAIGGAGLARGYLNNPELTAEKFQNPQRTQRSQDNKNINNKTIISESSGYSEAKLYRTGDLACWMPDGNIEFMGRKDHQVKIRGFRIELGEIENRLHANPIVKDAVVIDITTDIPDNKTGDIKTEKHLCAYIVPADPNRETSTDQLKQHLADALPDYMIPSYFITLEKIPLTPSGKVNRKDLPVPGSNLEKGKKTMAPGTMMEVKLAGIWAGVLNINAGNIGIDDNFFSLGGHSLKAGILTARIHKQLNIKMPLAQIFKTPKIRSLAAYLEKAAENIYASITPVETKEYYPVSSAEKRMFILNRLKGDDTSDNTPMVMKVEGKPDFNRFREAVKKLAQRQEILRTSFHQLKDGTPVQKVHPEIEFEIPVSAVIPEEINTAVAAFIRPFDLGKAPLFRIGFLKVKDGEYILMFDMHHIIADGTARAILIDEFITLYANEEAEHRQEIPELRIQYKDFSIWQNRLQHSEAMKKQEQYWLEVYKEIAAGTSSPPALPTDFTRPGIQDYEGKTVDFNLTPEQTAKIDTCILENGVTLYMYLIATYSILLSRWTGQTDVVVGTPIAGRPHTDLENIIGMFANTLALRNKPTGDKTFRQFLDEVKINALDAYENQDYQFEQLVEKLGIEPDPGRNPLFDTMFVVQNVEATRKGFSMDIKELTFQPYQFEDNITQFDIITHAFQNNKNGTIDFKMRYGVKLFKHETILRFIGFFKDIISTVTENPGIKLKDIKLSHGLVDQKLNLEKKELDFDF